MITTFAAIALQGIMTMPVSTSMSIATPFERANVATASAAPASTSVAHAQLEGGTAAVSTDETITVRRGSNITRERAPKGKATK
jgi:hypothetical protein